MQALITGGTGLIGRALATALQADGYTVNVLTRNTIKAKVPPGVKVHPWDARTTDAWGQLVEDADVVINLAGENLAGHGLLPNRWTSEQKRLIRESRIQAGEAVTQAIIAATRVPKVLIQASGIGYYGPQGDEIITEDAPAGKDFLARLAVEWEASTARVEEKGVRRAIIRTGVVLSGEGGALPKLVLPYRFFVGGPLGSGRQYISWIHLVDEVAGIRYLIDNQEASGTFNLVAPNALSNSEFGNTIGRVLKRPSVFPTPGFAMQLLLGEVSTLVLDGQRVIPQRLLNLGFRFHYPDAEQALRDLLTPKST